VTPSRTNLIRFSPTHPLTLSCTPGSVPKTDTSYPPFLLVRMGLLILLVYICIYLLAPLSSPWRWIQHVPPKNNASSPPRRPQLVNLRQRTGYKQEKHNIVRKFSRFKTESSMVLDQNGFPNEQVSVFPSDVEVLNCRRFEEYCCLFLSGSERLKSSVEIY
jgi:hypothetical protein